MKSLFLVGAVLGLSSAAIACNSTSGRCCAKPQTSASAATPAAASPDYPLNTCIVSGETLGSMGAPHDYIHKEAGKPDRLIRFCCKMCVGKFKKNPAKYINQLDEAAAQKKA